MNLEEWKKVTYSRLNDLQHRVESGETSSLTLLLAGITLWPIIEAQQDNNNRTAIRTFSRLSGKLELEVLEEHLDEWAPSMSNESETIQVLESAHDNSPLRKNLEDLLVHLEVLEQVITQNQTEQAWLLTNLLTEWQKYGRGGVIESTIQVAKNKGVIIGTKEEHHHHYPEGTPLPEQEKAKEYRQKYLDSLKAMCLQLPLASLGLVKRPDKEVSLNDVYINLDTTTRVKEDGSPLDDKAGPMESNDRDEYIFMEDKSRLLTMREAVQRHNYLVILGDPGSGKSTFVKRFLAVDCCSAGSALPLLIVLRSLAGKLREVANTLPADWQEKEDALANIVLDEACTALDRFRLEAYREAFQEEIMAGGTIIAFDGLDEVPLEERRLLKEAINAATNRFSPAQTLITCRIRSYHGASKLEGYPDYTLSTLNQEQMTDFCKAWYNGLAVAGAYAPDHATTRGNELVNAIRNPTIGEIGNNPMLLTTLAIVHEQDNHLPNQRVVLYDRAINILLTRWEGAREDLENSAGKDLAEFLRDNSRVRPVLQYMAYQAHNSGRNEGQNQAADIEWAVAYRHLRDKLGNADLAEAFLKYVDERAGLLVGEGDASGVPARFSFAHRTFQEYLAGCYLLKERDHDLVRQLTELAGKGEYWTLAIQLCGEQLFYNSDPPEENRLLDLASTLCPIDPKTDQDFHLVNWSAFFASLPGAEKMKANEGVPGGGGAELHKRLQNQLLETLKSKLPAIERAEAGRLLGVLGDPRVELLELDAMSFCYVPAGAFMMGSEDKDGEALYWEKPCHQQTIPYWYWIGQYAVTNGQYAQFVEAGGYGNRAYWSDVGWSEKEAEGWVNRDQFSESFQLSNHPVVGVSWYEAHAFTNWLNETMGALLPSGYSLSLPNELEWEKAVRGGLEVPQEQVISKLSDGLGRVKIAMQPHANATQVYSWGDEMEAEGLNFYEHGINRPTPGGCFESGASVYGAVDMLGNVLEWTRDGWSETYPMDKKEQAALGDPKGDEPRVWRGGSFNYSGQNCRCAYRNNDLPNVRYFGLGFRLVLRPSHER